MERQLKPRVVVHIDMDCFYVAVERKRNPELIGKPCVVAQYNQWQGGAIIAVSYEARALGVSRNMRGDEARALCPGLEVVTVEMSNGKADLTPYRDASEDVMDIIARFVAVVERASVDECYVEMTEEVQQRVKMRREECTAIEPMPECHVYGYEGDAAAWAQQCTTDEELLLLEAAVLTNEIRQSILDELEFSCSAGIAANKIFAKFATGMNKPSKQTVLLADAMPRLLETLPIKQVRSLGGKLGDAVISQLSVECMGDILPHSEQKLEELFGRRNGARLYMLARGLDDEPVRNRLVPKSIGCGKTFPGPSALTTFDEISTWLANLATELHQRTQRDKRKNKREASLLVLGVAHRGKRRHFSRSCPLRYGRERIVLDAVTLFERTMPPVFEVTSLSLSASSFVASNNSRITDMFRPSDAPCEKKPAVPLLSQPSSPPPPKILTGIQRWAVDVSTSSEGMNGPHNPEKSEVVAPSTSQTCIASDDPFHGLDDDDNNEDDQECARCGVPVASHERREHDDFHLALDLQNGDPNRARKRKRSPSPSGATPERKRDCERCAQCHLMVARALWEEHQDYHFAQDINMRTEGISVNKSPNISRFFSSGSTEKKKAISKPNKLNKLEKTKRVPRKSISSFFDAKPP